MAVGHEGVWVVLGFLGKWKGDTLQRRGRKTFFPFLCASRGTRWQKVPSKRGTVCSSFFSNEQFKRERHQNVFVSKNQSLIFYLFNQTLN